MVAGLIFSEDTNVSSYIEISRIKPTIFIGVFNSQLYRPPHGI